MLAAHAACWACGYAASRVDRDGNPAPISPPLARTLAAVVGTLTGAAAMGAFAGSELLRAIGGWGYAAALRGDRAGPPRRRPRAIAHPRGTIAGVGMWDTTSCLHRSNTVATLSIGIAPLVHLECSR